MPEATLQRWSASVPGRRVAVAFSGGLDSTVLLHALVRVLGHQAVFALHVHHGLQTQAEAWSLHCARIAAGLAVGFEVLRVTDGPPAGASVEAWARERRHALLAEALMRHRLQDLVLAHHADDQIETLLLRLGRGAGIAGLTGMQARSERVIGMGPIGTADLTDAGRDREVGHGASDGRFARYTLWRPFIGLPRHELSKWALAEGLTWIEDPSNDDARFTRNALRREALPALDRAMPGWRQAALRNMEHWRSAAVELERLADADLAPVRGAGWPLALDRRPLQALTPVRQAGALRAWLATLGLRAPSDSRLDELRRQLLDIGSVGALLTHDGRILCRDVDRVVAWPATLGQARAELAAGDELRRWEAGAVEGWRQSLSELAPGTSWSLRLGRPEGVDRGRLVFTRVLEQGADTVSLMALLDPAVRLDLAGSPGRQQRIGTGRRSRSLKHHYQERRLPPWLRGLLPAIIGSERALFSAAFGVDRPASASGPADGARVAADEGSLRIEWVPPGWLVPVLRVHGHPWQSH